MHTLSLFPTLFDFQLIGPFILRLALGYALMALVWREKNGSKHFSLDSLHGFTKTHLCELLVAIFIIVGLYTQAAAIIAIVAVATRWYNQRKPISVDMTSDPLMPRELGFHEQLLYIVICAIALSLLVLGAGFLAFDLPL